MGEACLRGLSLLGAGRVPSVPTPLLALCTFPSVPDLTHDKCKIDTSLPRRSLHFGSDVIVSYSQLFVWAKVNLPFGKGEEETGLLAKRVWPSEHCLQAWGPLSPASPLLLCPRPLGLPCSLCAFGTYGFLGLQGTSGLSHPVSGHYHFNLQHCWGLSHWVSLVLLGSCCHRNQRVPIRN